MRNITIEVEPWSDAFWADMEALAVDHFQEVDGGVEPNRSLRVDCDLMELIQKAGSLMILAARCDGRLIGYYTWQITPDVECAGLLIAQQGAWYVAPGFPRVAHDMFKRAVLELKARNVKCIYPHHRVQGRGANIGKFFKRQGAKEIQHNYSLWIGG